MFSLLLLLLLFISHTDSFFFPTSNSCGCSTPCPMCAPLPICPPVPRCPAPEPPCCMGCSCNKKKRTKRSVDLLSNGTYVVDQDVLLQKRVKRAPVDDVVKVDSYCNSEVLRDLIIQNMDDVTAVAKRQIQKAAEKKLRAKFNVICSRGDFSYITSTDMFCQQSVGDITCYLFKQSSEELRRRLAAQ